MNPNSIPFSSEVPKEEGAYLVTSPHSKEPHTVDVFIATDGSGRLIVNGANIRQFVDNMVYCKWCKLIPITALENAQKRVRELETEREQLLEQIHHLEKLTKL